MTIALEPMVLSGSNETRVMQDEWTVASKDGKLTAHFEHSVAITEDGPLILTSIDQNLDEEVWIKYNDYFAGRQVSAHQ
jgi:methionyl aminopeptidase